MRLALQSPQDPVAHAGLRQPFERGWGQVHANSTAAALIRTYGNSAIPTLSSIPPNKAKPDDLLMQMFQRDILKEWLVLHKLQFTTGQTHA